LIPKISWGLVATLIVIALLLVLAYLLAPT
jgi:hypothetical protein